MAWLANYTTRRKLSTDPTKVDATLTDFPTLVKLTSANFDFTKSTATGNDIRFTLADGTTLLAHERGRHDSTALKAEYWVKIPFVSATAPTDFYIYYSTDTGIADGANPTAVWDTNFKARWSLKEDPSGTAPQMKDSTVNVNHGTTHGAMTSADSVEGKIGRALDFDGVDDYVEVPSNTGLKLNDFTISCFVKGNTAPGTAKATQWLSKGVVGENYIFSWDHANAAFKQSVAFKDTGGVWRKAQIATTLFANTWYHITGRWDSTTDTLEVFLNGVLDGSETGITAIPMVDDVVLKIGSGVGGSPHHPAINFFDGQLDEVHISNIARSPAWLKATSHTGNDTLLTYGGEEFVFQPRGTSLGSPFIY